MFLLTARVQEAQVPAWIGGVAFSWVQEEPQEEQDDHDNESEHRVLQGAEDTLVT